MSEPTFDLHRAIIAALRASAALVDLFAPAAVPVFATAPPGADVAGDGEEGFPFIRVADYDLAGLGEPIVLGDVVDDPVEATATLHIFARGPDRHVDARQISRAIVSALADELAIGGGFKIVLGQMDSIRHFDEADGLTAHTVLAFRYHVEASEV